MFGNSDLPSWDRSDLPELMDHDEYRELRERLTEIEHERREIRERKAELHEEHTTAWFGLGGPSKGQKRAEAVLAGEDDPAAAVATPTEELAALNERKKDLDRARDMAHEKLRKLEGRASHELLEEADEVRELYAEIVEGMHRAAVELARWADAEREFRDDLQAGRIYPQGKLKPVTFPMALVERRRNSPMIHFLKRCEERHDLTCDLDY